MEPCLPGARVRVETPTPPRPPPPNPKRLNPPLCRPWRGRCENIGRGFQARWAGRSAEAAEGARGLSRLCGLELGGGHRGYRDIGFIELKAYAQQALWVGVGGGHRGCRVLGLKVYEASRA